MKYQEPLYPDLYSEPHPPATEYPMDLLADNLNVMVQEGAPDYVIKDEIKKYGYNLNSRDENDSTLLHYAAKAEHKNLAQSLVNIGADKDAVDGNGYTPAKIADVKYNDELKGIFSSSEPVIEEPEIKKANNYTPPRELTAIEKELIIAGVKIIGHLIIGVIKITYEGICSAFRKPKIQEVYKEQTLSKKLVLDALSKNEKQLAKLTNPEIEIIIKAKDANGLEYTSVCNHKALNMSNNEYIGIAHDVHEGAQFVLVDNSIDYIY